jgi:hypothetical protein
MHPTFLATIALVFVNLCLFTPNSLAQNERGYKGAIDKKTMLSIFEAGKSDPEKGWVDGYVVEGNDVIDIIRDTDLTIRIRHSVINGGLDFTLLPSRPIEEIEKPSEWNNKEWDDWINNKKTQFIKTVSKVENAINIAGCDILQIHGQNLSISCFKFPNTTILFGKFVHFGGSVFKNNAWFHQSTFAGRTSLTAVRFEGKAIFSHVTFGGSVNFGASKFVGAAEFKFSGFVKGASFSSIEFGQQTEFENTNFGANADFIGTRFGGMVNFDNSHFAVDAHFGGAKFLGMARFMDAKIGGKADFGSASFSSIAWFKPTSFAGRASFQGASFTGDVNFGDSSFADDADFSRANFAGDALMWRVHFAKMANFKDAKFNKISFFKNSEFAGLLSLDVATFRQYADFRETRVAQLGWDCSRNPTIIDSHIDFRNSIISEAHFEDLIFA